MRVTPIVIKTLTEIGCKRLAPLDPIVQRDARDGALIPLAYETGLRRSNVVTLTVEQVSCEPDGTATVLVERSKEDREGRGRVKALSVDTTAGRRVGSRSPGSPNERRFSRRRAPTSRIGLRTLSDRDVARIYRRRGTGIGGCARSPGWRVSVGRRSCARSARAATKAIGHPVRAGQIQ